MKKVTLIFLSLIFISIGSCSDDNNDTDVEETLVALTQQEIDDLNFLREEEKLARDVYLYAYDLYGLQIFNNISNSEQSHMDNVLVLLNKYSLADPASPNIGEFSDPDLQALYNSLTQTVEISDIDALVVGNIIEDLDINDIEENEARSTKIDLLDVYGILRCGSRNHLRNYNAQLIQSGGTYVPQYISVSEFEEIITSDNEKCQL